PRRRRPRQPALRPLGRPPQQLGRRSARRPVAGHAVSAVCLLALAPLGLLLVTRLRWVAMVSFLAGLAAAYSFVGHAFVLKALLAMVVAESVGAAVVRGGGFFRAFLGAAAGTAGFLYVIVHARVFPLFVAALAAAGAAGATLLVSTKKSR